MNGQMVDKPIKKVQKKKYYKINEPGGLVFGGKIYPEHLISSLDEWGKSDIQAAKRSGMITEIDFSPDILSDDKKENE